MHVSRERGFVQRLLLGVLCAAGGLLHENNAFYHPAALGSIHRTEHVRSTTFPSSSSSRRGGGSSGGGSSPGARVRVQRDRRTRLFESIRGNREKIGRAMNSLRDAMRSGDEELVERLKAFIMHLRKRDPQFATQDAMDEALEQGLFSTAAKLKLKLEDIKQNPFRHSLLDVSEDGGGGGGGGGSNSDGGDTSEDMSWGFDQTFFGEEGDNIDDDPDDYDNI
ncbi:unnamed protein product [Ectocarpus sp. CCAP 1310/34]|nr:unnamed protein product [Ectocarpus sp. CCAP 1310/34]